jgi:hypothetical protein
VRVRQEVQDVLHRRGGRAIGDVVCSPTPPHPAPRPAPVDRSCSRISRSPTGQSDSGQSPFTSAHTGASTWVRVVRRRSSSSVMAWCFSSARCARGGWLDSLASQALPTQRAHTLRRRNQVRTRNHAEHLSSPGGGTCHRDGRHRLRRAASLLRFEKACAPRIAGLAMMPEAYIRSFHRIAHNLAVSARFNRGASGTFRVLDHIDSSHRTKMESTPEWK